MDFLGLAFEGHEVDPRLETKPNLVRAFHGSHGEHVGPGKQIVILVGAVVARHSHLCGVEVGAIEDFPCVVKQARAFVGTRPNGTIIVYSEAIDTTGKFAAARSRIQVDHLVVGSIVESAIVVEDDDLAATTDDPLLIIVVDEQRADIDSAKAATQIERIPVACGSFHHREEFVGSRIGDPKVSLAVEG